ncbi:MAG: hypothetical protein GY861_21330 [bacterium]|nr:hypothetical protein [bacterium]
MDNAPTNDPLSVPGDIDEGTMFWRQLDILDVETFSASIIVVGSGGIGSMVLFNLFNMGFNNIKIYDPDVVEEHNLPNQPLFRYEDIGMSKVEAVSSYARYMRRVELEAVSEVFSGLSGSLPKILISGVDSMAQRQVIWDAVKYRRVELYIEGRMGAEVGSVYCTDPTDSDDIEFYERQLYSDEEAAEGPCTARAIIYNVGGLGSIMASYVKRHVMGEAVYRETVMDYKTMTLIASDE